LKITINPLIRRIIKLSLKDIEKKKAYNDDWDDPPGTRFLTLKEKWELEADDPLYIIKPDGKQYWVYPGGKMEEIKPDDAIYNHWYGK